MSKEIYISSTPHETRLAIVEDDALAEIYYERENEYTLAGSIYKGRVTRVLPGMQSSFVDIGLDRDAFLYITDFMEEAGDSADFEGNGDGQRSGRRDGRGDRNREPATLEGTTGEEGRERGGRGRRDRRDRGGNRQAIPEYSQTPEGQGPQGEEEFAQPSEAESGEALTERAEGAGEAAAAPEGGRRWRGRRGRRRGRGGNRDEARQEAGSAESTPAPDLIGDADEPALEIDGSAEQTASPESAAGAEDEFHESFSRRPRGDDGRDDRNRGDRDRGGRDRDRGGRRIPRGFAPRASFYGVGNSPADEGTQEGTEAAHEPIVLPGESLSKYRSGGEQQAAPAPKAAAPTVIVPSAPSYEIPAGWDGGSVLPGETLSRHRRSEPRQESQPVVEEPAASVSVEAVQEHAAVVPEVVEPVEYEPTEEASVSYRVDPIPPSEFRQGASIEVEPEVVHAAFIEVPVTETFEEQHVLEHVVELAAHEVTTLHASGEMESEAPVVDLVEAEAAQQAFEPGTGVVEVEEEIVEEEDFQTTTLHASSIEELDDLDEEETLEGAADLGSMIREMSIDEITRVGDGDEEEDDFIEEDSIHGHHDVLDEAVEEGEELDESDETEDEVAHDEDREGYAEAGEGDGAAPAERRDYDRGGDRGRGRGRRDGRRGDRGRGRHNGSGDRERTGGRDRRGVRNSVQATNLPAISELLKPGQEVLVQIAKEPIAKKGARITSHIALPGRFLVFMPTVNHTGVSRKIESDGERRRLKEILLSEKGDAAGGFIVRTAASGASEEELRSDLRFLLNLWSDIKQRSDSSKAPALIYHDLNLVERVLRDQVTDNFSAIWVDSEENYERILRFLQRFQPSLIRRVKLYTKEMPLFEQFGITEEINKALRSKVWLKSGGSIVINQTEALVAIDINTGKYVGKTARLEDTIVKTNLDAIPEIVRQIRLRDLGGIIIIDFIDMDERKNRNRVMAALEEELKHDRAPSKVLQFNDFGLVAITRKRVKQSLERTLSTTCNVCTGTGMVKSPVTVCNDIYIEMRKMTKHLDRGDVMLRVHPDVVKQLKSSTKWLQEMEEMVGKTILVKSDPSLHPEQFDIH
ncbi:Rne/Rng family ribonuclease [Edaphobacter bradus]|uniref:Rne/Rng family ribonuclease n=1 Tax=Edaphobacter bradus TaxID=2259016 RepID=UPI0021E09326|nr:Rne/Rng family ribonuclease [Edaphobacter bradus]